MQIYPTIDNHIKEAMKAHDKVRLEVMKSIKTAFINHRTAANAKPINETIELQILKKLNAQRMDAYEQYKAAGRMELADAELAESRIISEFLPKEMSEDEVRTLVHTYIESVDDSQKNIGYLMKAIRASHSNIDGKMLSTIIKETLGN